MNETDAEFWNERYNSGQIPWDFHGLPEDARRFMAETKPARALVPGCGSGYDVAAFRAAGWDVVGLELSPAAIAYARSVVGPAADVIQPGDFFSTKFTDAFDVVYERAFLCAIPPSLWTSYAARVDQLLRPGGRLAGYFFYGQEDEPPPYPLTNETARQLFAGRFRLEEDRVAEDALPIYAGGEHWQIWKRGS